MSDDFDVQTELRSAAGEWPVRVSVTDGRFGGQLRQNLSAGSAREYEISDKQVAQTGGPGSGWTEALTAYRGVRWRRQNLGVEGTRSRVKQIHLVDLVHDNPARTVPLFVRVSGRADMGDTWALVKKSFSVANASETEKADLDADAERLGRQATGDDIRDVWEGFAARLGLPAIDARGEAEFVREAGDLDTSLAGLARANKVDTAWDDTPPPPDLDIEKSAGPDESEALHIRIKAAKFPRAGMFLFYAIAAVMAVVGLASGQFGLVVSAILLGAVPRVIVHLQTSNPRRVTITRGAIQYQDPAARRGRDSFELALSDIESVHVETRNDIIATGVATRFVGNELVLSTDQFEHRLGEGLDDDALDWLRRHILAAIVNA